MPTAAHPAEGSNTAGRVRRAATSLLIALGLAAGVGGGLWGCVSREAADPHRMDAFLGGEATAGSGGAAGIRLPADAWPPRLTDDLDRIIRDTPRNITALTLDGTVPEEQINEDLLRAAKRPQARIAYHKRFGVGLIRTIRQGRRWDTTRFVSYSPVADRPTDERAPKFVEGTRRWIERYLSENAPGLKATDERTLAMIYEGTQIRIRRPEGRRPVGLIVHMAGLGSMEYEQPLLDELQSRGWAVLRIATPSVWWYQSKPIEIKSEADISPTGARLARVIDDLVAEPAYTAEAALEFLAAEHPDVPLSPLVMVGCSAGALATPAVVARMPDKFDAVVMVGAGANLLKLSQASDLTDGGIRILWSDDMGNAAHRNRLYDAYLDASRLDPYHTARTMLDKPVLVVQAALDSTVPASGGELLWERLGRPERWTFSGGHRLLFWRLKDHAEAIADWVDGATRKPSLTQAIPSADSAAELPHHVP